MTLTHSIRRALVGGSGGSGGGAVDCALPGARRRRHGKAVQVDPIKPTLKAPGIKLSKLRCGKPLSKLAFNFNLRRYIMVPPADVPCIAWIAAGRGAAGNCYTCRP